jgi:hypothetical protein
MPGKKKPSNGLNDAPHLKPLGKISGKGKGWKKYLQSNAVKAGLGGLLALLLVLIISWQLIFGGPSGSKPTAVASASGENQIQAPSPPLTPQTSDSQPAAAEQTSASAQPNGQPEPEQTTATQPDQTQPEQAQTNGESQGEGRGATNGTGDTTSAQPLSEDVTKWGKGDFIRARQENNPKLLEAIVYLGEKSPGNVPVAQQLAELLKPPKPPEQSDPTFGRSTGGYAMPGLIEATVNALAKNGSQAARQTMTQILTGKLVTEDDRTAVDAVLRALVLSPSPENDDIILKVLVSPEDIRAANPQGAWQPSDMRTRVLDLIRQGASENLCKKLAENLVQKVLEPNDPTVEFLLQDNPDNLSAQLVLYLSEDLSNEKKLALEQSFQNYSSQALGLMMGIPTTLDGTASASAGEPRGAGPTGSGWRGSPTATGTFNPMATTTNATREILSDYNRGVHLAKLLWGEPLASLMAESMSEVRSMERSAPDIVLASTLPLDSIHSAMYKMLKKRAVIDSPQLLESAGWTDNTITDPSMIVLLKLLPRSKATKVAPITGGVATSTTSSARSSRYSMRRPGPTEMGGAMGQPTRTELAQRKEQIEMEWLTSMSKMVGAWCTRLEAASQAQKRAIRRQQKIIEPQPTRLDEFELPQDAKILDAYQINWPEKAPAELDKAKPGTLKIQYFRLEISGMLKKTMNNFKRLTKGGDLHETGDGLWLETLKNGSQPNSKRSLDIIIVNSDGQPVDLTMKEETTDLQVDILAIEIADPAKD